MKRRNFIAILTASIAFAGCFSQTTFAMTSNIITTSTAVAYEESISIQGDNYAIPGTLSIPTTYRKGDKLPVVLMLHGTGSQKDEAGDLYKTLATHLAKEGYASLRIDFAGTGDSPVDYKEYTLTSATNDANKAIEYLLNRPEFNTDRIGLIGFSQGGLIGQLVASENENIEAFVSWSGVSSPGEEAFKSFFDTYYEEAKLNGFAKVDFDWRSPLNFSLEWFKEIHSQSVLKDITKYEGKLLAIAGSADTVVNPIDSVNMINAATSKDAAFYLLKDADHTFNCFIPDAPQTQEVLDVTVSWFKNNL